MNVKCTLLEHNQLVLLTRYKKLYISIDKLQKVSFDNDIFGTYVKDFTVETDIIFYY